MYDEALDFLFRYLVRNGTWSLDKRYTAHSYIEMLADLNNTHDDESTKYSVEALDILLFERKEFGNIFTPQQNTIKIYIEPA